MMGLTSDICAMNQASLQTEIAYKVAGKVMDSTSALQSDLLDQMLGKMGIGGNINTVA